MIEFGVTIIILALIGWLFNVALDYLATGHPPILNHLIWALVIVLALAKFVVFIGGYVKV